MASNPYTEAGGNPYAGTSFLDVLNLPSSSDSIESMLGDTPESTSGSLTGIMEKALDKNPNLFKLFGSDTFNRSDISQYREYMLDNAKKRYAMQQEQGNVGKDVSFKDYLYQDDFGRALYDGRVGWDDVKGLTWIDNQGEDASWTGVDWDGKLGQWRATYDPLLAPEMKDSTAKGIKDKWQWADIGQWGDASPYSYKVEYGKKGPNEFGKFLTGKQSFSDYWKTTDIYKNKQQKKKEREEFVEKNRQALI